MIPGRDGLLFEAPNGLRYLRVGRRGLCLPALCRRYTWEQENMKPEKCLQTAQTPTHQVHALLGMDLKTRLLFLLTASQIESNCRAYEFLQGRFINGVASVKINSA